MSCRKILYALCSILPAAMLFSAGCALQKSPAHESVSYCLDYPPPEHSFAGCPLPHVIRVDHFQPSDLYSSRGIIYKEGCCRASSYVYHRWITPPDRMIPELICRDLRSAGIVRAVFLDGAESADHRITGNIEEFYKQAGKENWKAVVAVSAALIETGSGEIKERICFQKTYKKVRTCSEKSVCSFVKAAGEAVSEISAEIASDVYKALGN